MSSTPTTAPIFVEIGMWYCFLDTAAAAIDFQTELFGKK